MPRLTRFAGLTALFMSFTLTAAQFVAAQDKGATPAPTTGDKTDIAWKFEKDKTFYQEMTTKTVQDMKVMGQDVKQTQEQTFYYSWTPKEQDKDGNWTVEQKVEGVKMKVDIAGNVISYDSTSPGGNNPLVQFFSQLVGSAFKLTIAKDMKVTKVEGKDEFLKKLGAVNQQMEPVLKQILSDDAMKQMADPTFGIVPGKTVTKGESWTKDSTLSLGPIGSYKNSYKYTLEGVDKDIAKIKVEATLTYEKPTASGDGLPFKIKDAKLKSKPSAGTIDFNLKTGRIEKSSLTVTLDGELDIEVQGTATKVELKQEQTTTITTSDTPQIKKASA